MPHKPLQADSIEAPSHTTLVELLVYWAFALLPVPVLISQASVLSPTQMCVLYAKDQKEPAVPIVSQIYTKFVTSYGSRRSPYMTTNVGYECCLRQHSLGC